MKSRDFVYWLQGFFEVSKATTLSVEQVDVVKSHLALVFVHEIDPAMGDRKHQQALNAVHGPGNGLPVMRC